MKVYHGSHTKIDTIDLTKSKANKDFGRGFYVTKYLSHAESWAKIIGDKNGTLGFVTTFEFDENDFTKSICKIKHFDSYSEEWLDFIVANRNKKGNFSHDYDIVIGPVADDKVQKTLRFYLNGQFEKLKFLKMLEHHEETHQICFCTLNSLQTIDKIEEHSIFEIVTITEQIIEQLITEFDYNEEQASSLFLDSAVYSKISNNTSLKNWTEIYKLLVIELNQNPNKK